MELAWYDDLDSYVLALGNGFSRLPLLRPVEPDRSEEWTLIINSTYAERGGGENGFRLQGVGEVLCLTDELCNIARAYALRTGRRFYEGIPESQTLDTQPVLIFGERCEFTASRFQTVGLLGRPDTAIMTAADLPGLSFLIAKTLTGASLEINQVGLIDAIDTLLIQWCHLEGDRSVGLPDFFDSTRPQFDRLVIHGHGDGAHLRLPSQHLCGRIGRRESGLRGTFLAEACLQTLDATVCRKCPGSLNPLAPSLLHCDELILLTCNGLSLAGEIYPSTSSLALSAIEGYSRLVLAPWSNIETSPENALLTFEASKGASIQDVRQLLNDRLEATLPLRPYNIVGDPWLRPSHPTLQQSGSARSESPLNVVPTHDAVVEEYLTDRFSRLPMLNAILRATREIYSERCDTTPEGSHRRQEAERAGQLLSAQIIRLSQEFASRENPTIARKRLDYCLLLESHWAQTFAELLVHDIWTGKSASLTRNGLRCKAVVSDVRCDRCGSSVIETQLEAFGYGVLPAVEIECPICGPVDGYDPTAGPLGIMISGPIEPNGTLSVSVRPNSGGRGVLGYHLKDKALGWFSAGVRAVDSSTPVSIPLNSVLGADLHVLRIAWFDTLQFTWARRLYAVNSGRLIESNPTSLR